MTDKECCKNCSNRLDMEEWKYKQRGVDHIKHDGFICLAFAGSDKVAIWMRGTEVENGMCEMFNPKIMTPEREKEYYEMLCL